MVFSFFTKRQPTQTDLSAPANIPTPETPQPLAKDASQQIHTQVEQMQLRTPSPSVTDSMSAANGARFVSEVPSAAPEPEVTKPPIEPTPESLTTLITSVPAKILHEYTLANIPLAEQPVLDALASFFATITPPPVLHCVRCHKDYVDIENDDRSCLVPHDDESAEVERVGRSGHERRTKEGTEYETLWGCCGKTTEGDGSQGPPDGWCYEGKHTVDIKRARFRADSTPQDDKLVSCLRLNCHGIRSRMPRASSSRKRARKSYKEQSSDEDESEGEADSGVDEIIGTKSKNTPKPKAKGKGKQKAAEQNDDAMDVDDAGDDNASKAGSAAQRQTTPTQAATPAPPKRPRGRPRKSVPADATTATPDAAKAPKRRGRPPKTKATIDDSDTEVRGRGSAHPSPVRSVVERRQTRSISRTRAESSASPNAFRHAGKPLSRSRTKLGEVLSGEASDSGEADDEQPKKKRKVVA